MRTKSLVSWIALFAAALACNLPGLVPGGPTPSPSLPTEPATAAPPSAVPTPLPTASPTAVGPLEALYIGQPGPGSRVPSPLVVKGMADPTFEQTVVTRLVLDDGTVLAQAPATIAAEVGERGPFSAQLEFTVSAERNALLQVYAESARDGGIIHLSSVGIILVPGGPPSLNPPAPPVEQLRIERPLPDATLSGGMVLVEGFGLASFEGTLLVEIYDAEGNKVGSQPAIVAAPDIGQPGPFSVQVPYVVSAAGPGRVVVIDPLPAFDGLGHIASVEVTLAP